MTVDQTDAAPEAVSVTGLDAGDNYPAAQRRPIPNVTVCERAPIWKTRGTQAADERV